MNQPTKNEYQVSSQRWLIIAACVGCGGMICAAVLCCGFIGMIGAFNRLEQRPAVSKANEEQPQVEGDVPWPTGTTPFGGVKVGPAFSKEELKAVAGRFIQRGIMPGWTLDEVLAVLGTPTTFSRTDGFIGMSPGQKQKFLDDPLIPPDVKASMKDVLEICTWSYADDPETYFISLGFENGRLLDGDHAIALRLPK
jgi:hypothetical protein